MTWLCTCTGGSASTTSLSRRAATASCECCGWKSAIGGKGSSSNSLLSTVSELTSHLNSDLAWTKFSKGNRSSSRRPRRTNAITFAGGKQLAEDSKGLEMPISESEKLGVSVLGCRFNEKAEDVPIKKRRFLFRTSSPPCNIPTPSPDGTERHPTFIISSSQGLQLNPNATPAACAPVADVGQSSNNGRKVDGEKLVIDSNKASDNEAFSGISILAAAACSDSLGGAADYPDNIRIVSPGTKNLEAPGSIAFKESSEKSANMYTEETDSHTSTAPSTMDHSSPENATSDNSSPDESTLDNSSSQVPSESEFCRTNQMASKTQYASARDRLRWDLNTVMDAWEEPVECDHEIFAADGAGSNITFAEEEKHSYKESNSGRFELGRECGNASESIGHENLHVDLKTLAHVVEELKLEECKSDGCEDISKQLSPVSAPDLALKKTKSLHHEHINSSSDAILAAVPSIPSMEYPTRGISAKLVNHNCMTTDDVAFSGAADVELSLDFPIPPGFDHCIKGPPSKENVDVSSSIVGVGNKVNNSITTTKTSMTATFGSESEKHDLSLMTVATLGDGAHKMGSTFKEDDEAEVIIAPTSNEIAMEDLVSKGSDLPQDTDKGDSKEVNKTTIGALLVTLSSVTAELEDQRITISSMHDAARSDAEVPNDAGESPSIATSRKSTVLLTDLSSQIPHGSHLDYSDDLVHSKKEACEGPLDNDFSHEYSQNDIRSESRVDKADELLFGYDSQYEDGELRESSVHAWEGYEEREIREKEYGTDNKETSFNLGTLGTDGNNSQCISEGSSRVRFTDVGSWRRTDENSIVLSAEKLRSSDQASGSGLKEMRNSTRQDMVKEASQLDQWKMNVSGWDVLPENYNSSSNFTKIRGFSRRRFSSREHSMETKAEGSRLHRRESLSRVTPPARDLFPSRGRFHRQSCSSNDADDLTSRPDRESSALRSFRYGKYSPHRANDWGSGSWNRSPERDRDLKRVHSPPYHGPSFRRSVRRHAGTVENLSIEGSLDPVDEGRPNASSYITRRSFRSRSPLDREEDDFRALLGLRSSRDMSHDRFINVYRGRSLRYGSSHNGGHPRGRYYGPANDDCDESLVEYPHHFPRRSRCFSPIERRGNHPYVHHRSDSRSPSRSPTRSPIIDGGFSHCRSRSPYFRSDARLRRPRSPNYRHGFEGDPVSRYNLEPRNKTSPPPPNSRWVNIKRRYSGFDRRTPPPPLGRHDSARGERFTFYDSSRPSKHNESYRSGHPGRFSELHAAGRGGPKYVENDCDLTNHGYRRGGFDTRYGMDRPGKHFRYDEEDGFDPVDSRDNGALEIRRHGNPRPYRNGTDNRSYDLPRRPREDTELVTGRPGEEKPVTGDFQRQPTGERKSVTNDFQKKPREEKDQSIKERSP